MKNVNVVYVYNLPMLGSLTTKSYIYTFVLGPDHSFAVKKKEGDK